jgi:hypothetical protein
MLITLGYELIYEFEQASLWSSLHSLWIPLNRGIIRIRVETLDLL